MSRLQDLDLIAAGLRQRFPGWRIWFVPQAGRDAAWCATPWPLLNGTSPEHLAAEIMQAHAEAAAHWPALRLTPGAAIPAPREVTP